jgi:hypothetical protein
MLAQETINTTNSKRNERAQGKKGLAKELFELVYKSAKRESLFMKLSTKVESALKGCAKDDSIVYLDTCYLLNAMGAGLKATELVLYLSQFATIIITEKVLEEVQNNLTKAEFSQEHRGEALADLMALYSLTSLHKDIVVEAVEVTAKERIVLGERMRKLDPSGNSRVGAGEASIYNHLIAVKELFKSAFVISNDSDVGYLFQGMEGVSVLTA